MSDGESCLACDLTAGEWTLPDDDAARIAELNARELYRFPRAS